MMNKLKRKSLHLALAAGLGAVGVSGAASAVHVNPDGLGQALIYPYYTVRAANGAQYNTYLSVTNTTGNFKAIKVRFVEGKDSREVLDFNVYLSPYDVWTAAVVPVSSDKTLGAKMITADTSCMVPAVKSLPFVNYGFISSNADGEDTSLDRTNEGYFEILEMADLTGTITTGLKHSNGTPVDCTVLGANESNVSSAASQGSGGLLGSATLINPSTGAAYGYDPTVLDDWNQLGSIWTSSGSVSPDLGNVFPKVSTVFNGSSVIQTTWTGGGTNAVDPVSAVLMHDNVINEFVLDANTLSNTDWVVTFPTKRKYVANDAVVSGVRQNTPASRLFQSNFWTGGSCDSVTNTLHDREEAEQISVSSPPPPIASDILCWEANVWTFNGGLLGSTNSRPISNPGAYADGWMNMNIAPVNVSLFYKAHTLVAPINGTTINGVAEASGTATTYFGLPVVGFMVDDYVNIPVAGSLYGGRYNHKATTTFSYSGG